MNKNFEEFLYFNNTINYIKNLTNKNISKDFNENIKRENKDSVYQILLYITIILTSKFIPIDFIPINFIIKFIMLICILFSINLFMKILILNKFSNSYYSFIQLCEYIVKFDNKTKEKTKIKFLLKSNNDEIDLILIETMKKINSIINFENNNSNQNNKNKESMNLLFNEYQNQKQKLFKYIFFNYEKEYLIKELYIIKFLKTFLNYSNHFNTKLNYIINIFKSGIHKLDIDNIDFDSYFKDYEKYFNKNIIKEKEKKKKEINDSIYNLFESNYKLNEYFMNLIKEINLENYNYEKINEIIEYIIEKKKLSISLLEQIKSKINIDNENKIIDNNENKSMNDIQKSISNFIKKENNKISLSDIQLNNYVYNSNNNSENKNENKYNNNRTKLKSNIDQEKIETLKSDFVDELNKYFKSKQKSEEENINDNKINIMKKDEDKINYEDEINKNKMKMDFAKSLTMCLKNNKNFKFNLNENNKDD